MQTGKMLDKMLLHIALRWSGVGSFIQSLIILRADFDAEDSSGDSPLHLVCKFEDEAIFRSLLHGGANVHSKNGQGMACTGHVAFIKLIMPGS